MMSNVRINKILIWGLFVAIIAGALMWWGGRGSAVPSDQETFKIGGAFAVTGFASEWGTADLNGATLAIEEANQQGGINGKQVKLIVEDITSDSPKVISAVQKLINVDQVEVIIGPTWFDTFAGAAPLADQNQVVMLTPSGVITAIQSTQDHQYAFSTYFRSDTETEALVNYLVRRNQKKVALIFENESFWQDFARLFKENAQKAGVEVVADMKLSAQDTDFRTPLAQLKTMNPDAIVFGFANENSQLGFLKQRAEVYPEAVLYTNESMEAFATKESYRGLLTNVAFIAPKVDVPDFKQKYKDRFGVEAVFTAPNAYDATNIVLKALAAGYVQGHEIQEYLSGTTFDTVTFGPVEFDDLGGVRGGSFHVSLIQDNKVIPQND